MWPGPSAPLSTPAVRSLAIADPQKAYGVVVDTVQNPVRSVYPACKDLGRRAVDADPPLAVPGIPDVFRRERAVNCTACALRHGPSQAEALALKLWIVYGLPPFAAGSPPSGTLPRCPPHPARSAVPASLLIMSTNSDPSITTASLLDADSLVSAISSAVRGGERGPPLRGIRPSSRGACDMQYSMYPRADPCPGSIARSMPAERAPAARPEPRAASDSPARACPSGDARCLVLFLPAVPSSWYSSMSIARS